MPLVALVAVGVAVLLALPLETDWRPVVTIPFTLLARLLTWQPMKRLMGLSCNFLFT